MKVGCPKGYLHSIQAQVLIWPHRTSTYRKPVITKTLEEQTVVMRKKQRPPLQERPRAHCFKQGWYYCCREKTLLQRHGSLQKKKKGRLYTLCKTKTAKNLISGLPRQHWANLHAMRGSCNTTIQTQTWKPSTQPGHLVTFQAPELLSTIPPSTDPHQEDSRFSAQRSNNIKPTLSVETQQCIISSHLFGTR